MPLLIGVTALIVGLVDHDSLLLGIKIEVNSVPLTD